MPVIRPATAADLPWMKRLFGMYRDVWPKADLGSIWYRSQQAERHCWLVAEPEAGFVHYYERLDGTKNVQEIAVSAARNGTGRSLMEAIGGAIILKTNWDNAAANAFYARIGFTLVGTTKTRTGERMNVWQRW